MPSIRLPQHKSAVHIVFVQPHGQDAYVDSVWTNKQIAKVIARDIAELRFKFPLATLAQDELSEEYHCDEEEGYWDIEQHEGVWIISSTPNQGWIDRKWRIRKGWFNTDPPESGAQHLTPPASESSAGSE